MSGDLYRKAMQVMVGQSTRKAVFTSIAFLAFDDNRCLASDDEIAGLYGYSVRTVRKHLKALISDGFVKVSNERGYRVLTLVFDVEGL
ncbi:MAG: hypothetical protein C0605_07755 [Hyphomicrobiales bacterium]|nr:MAG: hypothetical protein C0605_07755 [Hyphomicrobiales bacterium]